MAKAKEFFRAAKTKLSRAFHIFKRERPYQHQGINSFTSFVQQGTEVSSNDSGVGQLAQQGDPSVPTQGQSTLRYVISNYMEGSSEADYDSILDSAGQLSEKGHGRFDNNLALQLLKSEVTETKLSELPESEESPIGSALTPTSANILGTSEVSGQETNASTWNLLLGQTLRRHRHHRSLSDWLEEQVFEPRPTNPDLTEADSRGMDISEAPPSSRHLSSGNSSADTFGRWRRRRPDDGLAPTGVPDPFVNHEPTAEQRGLPAMTLDELNHETPSRWSADFDKFSSDGQQRKLARTASGNFSLRPQQYSLKTPPQRPRTEEINVRKNRERTKFAADTSKVSEEAENVAANDTNADKDSGQPASFQPGAAVLGAQTAMESMHRSFWQVDAALRQLSLENQTHQKNMRTVLDRNQALEQELERAHAVVREKDAELELLRRVIGNVAHALLAFPIPGVPGQAQQKSQGGSVSPISASKLSEPQTPANQALRDYSRGYTMRKLSTGSINTDAANTPQKDSDEAGSVVPHEVIDPGFGFDMAYQESETSDMYGGDDYVLENKGADEEYDGEDEGEKNDGASGTPLSSSEQAAKPESLDHQETPLQSSLGDSVLGSLPRLRPRNWNW
ncbi:hypothetical protein Z517_10966 [Fonsecaea pedrosoi CBS 271.37]|uniref:Uncharacterized protein n=1 Tax=Fonsecaea pedrosoi CBS 271.37 TaxID=1442368 RepID=A0A0D2GBP3_9EURO|nr:uncharacterized protein Z517_10966 [Fonsecaea pedrosoi CBS 271.37]KIW76220.1 hypothetical protein Z517_10966 [Fonsecaea pedrosoi CBS 271.37]